MRKKAVMEIQTDNYDEQQFIMNKFPDSIKVFMGNITKFYISYENHYFVQRALKEWIEIIKSKKQ